MEPSGTPVRGYVDRERGAEDHPGDGRGSDPGAGPVGLGASKSLRPFSPFRFRTAVHMHMRSTRVGRQLCFWYCL